MKNRASEIHVESCQGTAVSPTHHIFQPIKISLLTRKLLRSKKLTRWFILPHRTIFQMMSVADMPPEAVEGKIQLLKAEKVNEQMPLFSEKNHAENIAQPLGYIFPPIHLFRIRDAKVFGGSNRFVVLKDRLVSHELFNLKTDLTLEELHQTLRIDVQQGTALKIIKDPQPIRFEQAASFIDAASFNYAHWITEILVRVFLLQTHPGSVNVPLLVDEGLHPNMRRSLDVVVSPQAQIYYLPKNREAHIQMLHHTSVAGYIPVEPRGQPGLAHGKFSPAAIKGMVSHIKNRLRISEPPEARRKIYVKRNSSYRNLVNSAAIESVLKAAGFECIEPEKMSFDEQVKAFHSAKVVVGATGAAMANIVFCQADCQLFILISKHPEMPYFYWQNIASIVNLKVHYVLGKCSPHSRQDLHADFEVAIEDLKAVEVITEPV